LLRSVAVFASLLLAGNGCVPQPAPDPPLPSPSFGDADLVRRVALIESEIVARGGRVAVRHGPLFLRHQEAAAVEIRIDPGECALIVGLAAPRLVDLDLYLVAPDGRRVAADSERHAHPVVVHCPDGASGGAVVAVPLSHDGTGEVYLGDHRFPASAPIDPADLPFEDPPPAAAAPAAPDEPIEDAIERWDRWMAGRGYRREGEVEALSLRVGGRANRTHRVDAGRCLGIALFGTRTPANLDLVLRDGTQVLAQDRSRNKEAAAVWCAARETDVRIDLEATAAEGAGRGDPVEARWMAYEALPSEVVYETPSELPPEPSPGVDRPAPDDREALEAALRAAGYEPDGAVRDGTLGLGARTSHPLSLTRGVCYEIVGFPRSDGIRDLDMVLLGPTGAPILEDRDQNNRPRIAHCPDRSDTYTLQLHAYDGAGDYELQVYRLAAPISDVPGLTGRLASRYAQTAAECSGRGFRTLGTPELGPVAPGNRASRTLRLQRGSCYLVAAIASAEEMDLDLEIHDYGGRLVAVDVRWTPDAQAFVCPDRTAPYGAAVTLDRGSGQYLLAVFENKAE
jgi:hypothetical protein